MKQTLTFLATLIFSITLYAQSPHAFKYQAVVRDNAGNALNNKLVSLRISILKNSVTGLSVYSETFHPITNEFGLVNLEIGRGVLNSGNFSAIDWANGEYFLLVEVDINGGSNYLSIGTSQLLSVPYALFAKSSGNGFTGNYNDLKNKPNLADTVKYLTQENDPVYAASVAKGIKSTDTSRWNAKSNFNGDYNLLHNKPPIPNSLKNLTLDAGEGRIYNVGGPIEANDAATKAYVDNIKIQLLSFIAQFGLDDIDGNTYDAVRIGNQVWMKENLRTTKYNDGTPISNITDYTAWKNSTLGAYCWYNNDEASYKSPYGALYNWHAVNTGKLCPTSWHVPSENEWITLENYLGGWEVAGGKMKESGTTHWTTNTGATNSSGFTGLPGGTRNNVIALENYININSFGYWWSTSIENNKAKSVALLNYSDDFYHGTSDKVVGNSIRCIKD